MAGQSDSVLEIPLKLEVSQLDRLGAVFALEGKELNERLGDLASAALTEYALAFSGVRSPSTIRDLRELRLRLLYEFLPDEEPTDLQVAQLFQMTPAQAGTLIANTRARFEAELDARSRKSAGKALAQASRVDDDTVRIRVPDSLARYLKDLVSRTAAPQMEKRKDASQTYDLTRPTVSALCKQLGIEREIVAALDWSD
jgi:hypothetical protein